MDNLPTIDKLFALVYNNCLCISTPPKKGQPLNNGQNARPQLVHYSEAPLVVAECLCIQYLIREVFRVWGRESDSHLWIHLETHTNTQINDTLHFCIFSKKVEGSTFQPITLNTFTIAVMCSATREMG